ncbi:hypothetical protein Smp_141260 [Schistosoma mansoni]|uniref:hypothetical protein n=1 Tax=Schistosoma mansoni TaxID=6183 RepID=UPI0001A94216|nr:hypothetical protein Smp_141260 [Schistosoma mansoni]|eukprot:XP_018647861.1 hypothetical protein Smp_141260 [Schistosoma mansoni]
MEGCGWRHHTLLHRKREERKGSSSISHINTQLCTQESAKRVQRQLAEEKIVHAKPESAKPKTKVPSANKPKSTVKKQKKVTEQRVRTEEAEDHCNEEANNYGDEETGKMYSPCYRTRC